MACRRMAGWLPRACGLLEDDWLTAYSWRLTGWLELVSCWRMLEWLELVAHWRMAGRLELVACWRIAGWLPVDGSLLGNG